MINNDQQLRQASEAISDLYQALASYRARILPVNPRTYRLIAQGPLDEIRKIQEDIDSYLGLQETVMTAETLHETPPDSHA
jgi:hypothetical protein